MKAKAIGKISSGQDGAIWGDLLFRLDHRGFCRVFDIKDIAENGGISPVGEFTLDCSEHICPHSNAVMFGAERFAEGDEFPLLYSNVYNNYAKSENKRCGWLCVYRITREGGAFSSRLVQLIEVDFTNDRELWRSSGDIEDKRPYGNFAMDREAGRLFAFVMRDGHNATRYFAFNLPSANEGEACEFSGVKKFLLGREDILYYFDTPYHSFIQGATCKAGKVYSLEGFGEQIHPAIRVIDTEKRKEIFHFDFYSAGIKHEAEMIDFHGDRLYYGDFEGNIFEIDMEREI